MRCDPVMPVLAEIVPNHSDRMFGFDSSCMFTLREAFSPMNELTADVQRSVANTTPLWVSHGTVIIVTHVSLVNGQSIMKIITPDGRAGWIDHIHLRLLHGEDGAGGTG